jgi:hypothetical protein
MRVWRRRMRRDATVAGWQSGRSSVAVPASLAAVIRPTSVEADRAGTKTRRIQRTTAQSPWRPRKISWRREIECLAEADDRFGDGAGTAPCWRRTQFRHSAGRYRGTRGGGKRVSRCWCRRPCGYYPVAATPDVAGSSDRATRRRSRAGLTSGRLPRSLTMWLSIAAAPGFCLNPVWILAWILPVRRRYTEVTDAIEEAGDGRQTRRRPELTSWRAAVLA